MNEYLRPWKLITLAIGVALLVTGALLHVAPDWDVPISIIMAGSTYVFAPWSIRVIVQRCWALIPLALMVSWFTIDGAYSIYWYLKDPAVLELMRSANFGASTVLYVTCGLLWMYNGSLKELING